MFALERGRPRVTNYICMSGRIKKLMQGIFSISTRSIHNAAFISTASHAISKVMVSASTSLSAQTALYTKIMLLDYSMLVKYEVLYLMLSILCYTFTVLSLDHVSTFLA